MKTQTKAKPWIGWHFLPENGKTRYSHKLVRVNSVLEVKGTLQLCSNGLHASRNVMDALKYAPGPIACLVELRGERIDESNKSCARERKCLGKIDATRILREFGCWVAWQALRAERKAGREPDKRSWGAVIAAKLWIAGKIGDIELDAAWSAARSAAESAAWSAAESAAWSAAWSAAESAAESAAWSAADSAARGAAWSAARGAAESAAWSAAWGAVRKKQNRKLASMLKKAIRDMKEM